jgi:hypothetical protein
MAVAHDNDLQLIETMVGPGQNTCAPTELERAHRRKKDSLTDGAVVENFLRENKFPVLLENGGMCPVTLQGMPGGAEYYFR